MTIASDNLFPSILLDEVDPEALAADPAAGQRRLAVGTDHLLYLVDNLGAKTLVGAGGIADILDIPTAETDDTLVLAPDGIGGVEFRAETGGGGGYAQAAIATRTAGDLTTTSTTFVDVTDMTVTLTTGASRCLVFCSALGGHTGASGSTLIDIAVDGTRQGQTLGLTGGNSAVFPMALTFLTSVLSAGSHTIKLQWKVDSGTAQFYASTAVSPAILTVIELIAA